MSTSTKRKKPRPSRRKPPEEHISRATFCKRCNEKMDVCRDKLHPCPSCGEVVAICTEPLHRAGIFCKAHTAAREPKDRGLIRCPADGLVPMLDEAGVPYERHRTKIVRAIDLTMEERKRIRPEHANSLVITEEAWIPPEAPAIVQMNRPLEDRMAALKKFAGYLAKRAG